MIWNSLEIQEIHARLFGSLGQNVPYIDMKPEIAEYARLLGM